MLIYEASRNLSTYQTPIEAPVAPTSAVRLSNPPCWCRYCAQAWEWPSPHWH